MTDALDPETRDRLLADPGAILADRDLMRALVAAREAEVGDTSSTSAAARCRRWRPAGPLESTHESVIAAAMTTSPAWR